MRSRQKLLWILASLSGLASFTSCTLYPSYERPSLESSDQWRTPLATEDAVEISWWKQFQDPILNELIDEALQANQDILAAMARVDQFKAELGIANSRFYPQLVGQAAGSRQQMSKALKNTSNILFPVFNALSTVFQPSYYADLWGEVRSSSASAYHEWIGSIQARRSVVLAVVTSVASTYVQLRQFDVQLVVSRDTLKTRTQAYELAKVRYELGLTSLLEVEQAIAEMEIAEVQVEQFQIAIALAENLICTLLGQTSRDIPRGLSLDNLCMPTSIPSCVPANIVCQRPDVLAAEEALIAANARIGIAWAQFFPQLNLLGAIGAESSIASNFFTNAAKVFEIGATVLQEIFTGGKLTSNADLADAVKLERLHMYLKTVLTAFQEVNDALTSHKLYLELVDTQRLRVEATKQYLHLSDLRYQEGEIDYLTFLDAERQYFQAQLDYEETVGNSFVSYVRIYQALGGPWVIEADDEVMKESPCKVTIEENCPVVE